MTEEAERLGQFPSREGVGAVPLVHKSHAGFQCGVQQVHVIGLKVLRLKQALIDDCLAGQRREIKLLSPTQAHRVDVVFDSLANEVQLSLKISGVINPVTSADENLLDMRLIGRGNRSQNVSIYRDFSPSQEVLTFFLDDFFKTGAAALPFIFVFHEEN